MNPLPNRPLLNNASLPLALPNVPSFDQMAYNGRPRKVMPEAGKEFPMLNGVGLMSGPSSAPAATGNQLQPLERSNPMASAMIPPQQQQQLQAQSSQLGQQQHPIGQPSQPPQLQTQQLEKEREGESEPRQLTAIFRPDDDWKERLRLANEASEQARLSGQAGSSGSSWERRREDEEDVKEDDGDVEEEESSVVGEGDNGKVWKAKRTLRKSVV